MARSIQEWLRQEVYGPEENRRLRASFAIAGMGLFWGFLLILRVMATPSDDTSLPVFLIGFWWFSAFVASSLLLYVRLLHTLVASLATGAAMVGIIVWAIIFILTSSSSTAGLAVLSAVVYNFGVLVLGWLLDHALLRFGGS